MEYDSIANKTEVAFLSLLLHAVYLLLLVMMLMGFEGDEHSSLSSKAIFLRFFGEVLR